MSSYTDTVTEAVKQWRSQRRKQAPVSQWEIARALGITQAAVSFKLAKKRRWTERDVAALQATYPDFIINTPLPLEEV